MVYLLLYVFSSIAQHSRDLLLLESFVNFLASGFVMNYKKTFSMWVYYYKNFWLRHNIVEHIIPFFDKHPCYAWGQSTKITWKSAAYIIKNKEHLNEDGLGLEEILQLKRRITSLYSNKAMNNHSVVYGTEKLDQKR